MDRLLSAMQLLLLKIIAWRPTQSWLWKFSTVTGAVGIVLTLLLFLQQSTGAPVAPDKTPQADLGNESSNPAEEPPATADAHPRRNTAVVRFDTDDEPAEKPNLSADAGQDPFDTPNRAERATAPERLSSRELTFSDQSKEPEAENSEEEFFQPEEKTEEKHEEKPAEQLTLLAPTHDEPEEPPSEPFPAQDSHTGTDGTHGAVALDTHAHSAEPEETPIHPEPESLASDKPAPHEPLQIADASQSKGPNKRPHFDDGEDDQPASTRKPTPVPKSPAVQRSVPAIPPAQSLKKSPMDDEDSEVFQKPDRPVPTETTAPLITDSPAAMEPPKPVAGRPGRPNPFEEPDTQNEPAAIVPKRTVAEPPVRRNMGADADRGDNFRNPSPAASPSTATNSPEVKPIPMPPRGVPLKAAQQRPVERVTSGNDDDAFLSKPAGQNRTVQVEEEPHLNSVPPKQAPVNPIPMNDARSNPMPPEPRVTPDVYRRPRGPKLFMEITAPNQVPLGDVVAMQFKIQNVGTETATGVVAFDELPEGLKHAQSSDLEYRIGKLAPGEVRFTRLMLTAAKTGPIVNRAIVRADGGISAEAAKRVEIFEQRISIKCNGPERVVLGCPSTFSAVINNSGNEPLRDVLVEANLPAGANFQGSSEGGRFDSSARSVSWRLAELPPGEKRAFLIRLTSTELGSQAAIVRVRDANGDAGQSRWEARVECPGSGSGPSVTYGSPIGYGTPISYGGPIGYGY